MTVTLHWTLWRVGQQSVQNLKAREAEVTAVSPNDCSQESKYHKRHNYNPDIILCYRKHRRAVSVRELLMWRKVYARVYTWRSDNGKYCSKNIIYWPYNIIIIRRTRKCLLVRNERDFKRNFRNVNKFLISL